MEKRLFKPRNGDSFEQAIMSAETAATGTNARKRKNAKDKQVKISMSIVCNIIASYLLSLFIGYISLSANAQDVIYSNNKISIHAKKTLSNDHLVIKNIEQLMEIIKIKFIDGKELSELAKAFSDDINATLTDYKTDLNHMFYGIPETGSNQTKKRYIDLLGDIIKEIAGNPSGRDWERQVEVSKKLLKIVKGEQKEIKGLKRQLKHDKIEFKSYLDSVKAITLILSNKSNEISLEKNISIKLIELNRIHSRGKTLLHRASRENDERKDIIEKSILDLPSKIMFPVDIVKETIREHGEYEKIVNPVFYTDGELNSLYNFECCKTLFHRATRTFHSYLELPWTDFSNKMMTINIPELKANDLNRLHAFETFAKKRIDRILCSNKLKTIRLLSTTDLGQCQKHRQKDLFLCSKREVMIKIDSMTSCNDIKKLPDVLALELTNDHYIVDRKINETLNVYCNEKLHHQIQPHIGTITVTLPKVCILIGNSIKIGTSIEDRIKTNITKDEKITITPIKLESFKPYHNKKSEVKEIYENLKKQQKDEDTYSNDHAEKVIDDEITDAQSYIYGLETTDNSIISIVALSVGMLVIPVYIIVKKCKTKLSSENSTLENKNRIEMQKRINDLEGETLKLNGEINSIRKDLLEKYNAKIENLIAALDSTERKVRDLMNDENKVKNGFAKMVQEIE